MKCYCMLMPAHAGTPDIIHIRMRTMQIVEPLAGINTDGGGHPGTPPPPPPPPKIAEYYTSTYCSM